MKKEMSTNYKNINVESLAITHTHMFCKYIFFIKQ